MGRAPCCDKVKVKKGAWSPEEDSKLKAYIEQHGTGGNWIALPQKVGLRRCGKSCRFRWLNYLRPNIRHGGFSKEEDNIIYNLYASIGSRWSIIAAQLPGRTDNDVKNHWNTKLKKRLLEKWEDQQDTCLAAAKGTEVSQANTNTSLYRAQPTARVDQIMNMNGPVPQLDEQTRCIEGPTIADADPLNLEKAFDQERLLSDHDFAFRTLGEELEATLFDNPITTDQMVTSNCISDNSNACPMFYSMQDACTIMLN